MDRINWNYVIGVLALIAFVIFIWGGEDCGDCYSPEVLGFKSIVVGFVVIGASFYYSYKWYANDPILFRVSRQPLTEIRTITSEIPAAFSGIITSPQTIISKYTNTPCVFYHSIKEEEQGSGDNKKWVIIENECRHVPFSVDDGSGQINVNLRFVDSDLSTFKIEKKFEDHRFVDYGHSEVDAEKKAFHKPLGVKQRISEYVLSPGKKIFVYGFVYKEENQKIVAEAQYIPLVVSRKTKEAFLEDFTIGDEFFYQNNFLLFIGSTLVFIPLHLGVQLDWIYLAAAFFLISLKMTIESYNRIVELHMRIKNAQSQIKIELNKRSDLIPMLETVTKTYAKYEQELLQAIALIRSDANTRPEQYAQNEKALNRTLIGLAERYPNLKSEKVFSDFMARLSQIEENIAYYRGFYSKTVLKYNSLVQSIPFKWLASAGKFKPAAYFEAKKNEQKPITVALAK